MKKILIQENKKQILQKILFWLSESENSYKVLTLILNNKIENIDKIFFKNDYKKIQIEDNIEEILSSINYMPLESSHVREFFNMLLKNKKNILNKKIFKEKYFYRKFIINFLEYFTNINELYDYYNNMFIKEPIVLENSKSNLYSFFYIILKNKKCRIYWRYFINNEIIKSSISKKSSYVCKDDVKDLEYIYKTN